MAIDLLLGVPGPHLYRYDLESFFYVLVWIGCNYDAGKKIVKGYPKWGNSSNEGMAKVKIQFLSRKSPFRLTPTFEPLGLTWLYIMMRLITEGFYELDKWRKGLVIPLS